MSATREVRVCVVGDELVAGVGDPRGLGWVGRVVARTPQQDLRLSAYQLAVPRETTAGLGARWEGEAAVRWRGPEEEAHVPRAEPRLVLGLGIADLRHRTTSTRSRLNLANVLDAAEAKGIHPLVVGPPPAAPQGPDGDVAAAIGELSAAWGDVCRRRRLTYVDTWTPLQAHEEWFADLASGDGRLPGQSGYGLLAWLVLHAGWNAWLGVEG